MTRASAAAPADIGVGELRLRAVHRRFEPAVHADFDEPQERGNVIGHAGHELLERRAAEGQSSGQRGRPRARRCVFRLRLQLGDLAAEAAALAALRVLSGSIFSSTSPFLDCASRISISRQPSSSGSSPDDVRRQKQCVLPSGRHASRAASRARLEPPYLWDRRPAALASAFRCPRLRAPGGTARRQEFAAPARWSQTGRRHRNRRAGDIRLHQQLPQRRVGPIELRGFGQQSQRISIFAFLAQISSVLVQLFNGGSRICNVDARACAREPGLEIRTVQIAKPDTYFSLTSYVSSRTASSSQRPRGSPRDLDEEPLRA